MELVEAPISKTPLDCDVIEVLFPARRFRPIVKLLLIPPSRKEIPLPVAILLSFESEEVLVTTK